MRKVQKLKGNAYLARHPVHALFIDDDTVGGSCGNAPGHGDFIRPSKLWNDFGLQEIDLVAQAQAAVTVITPNVHQPRQETSGFLCVIYQVTNTLFLQALNYAVDQKQFE